jgi:tRNA-Thr(GGU) m(6)t(6)A37 methyltransferase TsaA
MESIILNPIGVVRSTRSQIADDNWDAEKAYIELDPSQFSPEAFAGLSEFSHVQILFFMNQVNPDQIETASRHPRNNHKWPKVGIFAHRAKNRPNRTGITICEILKLDGLKLYVEGLDAIDGTPVLDIKPWVAEFGPRGPVRQPAWMTELMRGYWR